MPRRVLRTLNGQFCTNLDRGRHFSGKKILILAFQPSPFFINKERQKNVYSVFRYSPLSIGFAELSASALAENGSNGPPPSPTIGPVEATVSATSVPRAGGRSTNNGVQRVCRNLVSLAGATVVGQVVVFSALSLYMT